MRVTLFGLLGMQIMGFITYACIVLVMIYGWGLQVKSWFWVIVGYWLATNMWILIALARENLLKALRLIKDDEAEKEDE